MVALLKFNSKFRIFLLNTKEAGSDDQIYMTEVVHSENLNNRLVQYLNGGPLSVIQMVRYSDDSSY